MAWRRTELVLTLLRIVEWKDYIPTIYRIVPAKHKIIFLPDGGLDFNPPLPPIQVPEDEDMPEVEYVWIEEVGPRAWRGKD